MITIFVVDDMDVTSNGEQQLETQNLVDKGWLFLRFKNVTGSVAWIYSSAGLSRAKCVYGPSQFSVIFPHPVS